MKRLAAWLLGLSLYSGAAFAAPYNWQTLPFGGGGFVDGFLYHPKAPDLLYARTDVGGLYRFDYAASRWIPLMDGFGRDDWDCMGVVTMAVDAADPKRLYATCGIYLNDRVPDARLLRSDDQGGHWQKTKLPFKLGGNAMGRGTGERLQVDGDTLWLGTNQDGLWVSHDRGVTITRAGGYKQKSVSVVLLARSTIYAGSGEMGEGLFASHDGGATFAAVPASPKLIPHQMAMDADGTLFITFADGLGPWGVKDGAVWKLKDGRWTDITPAKPSAQLTFGYSGLDLQKGVLVVSTSNRYPGRDDLYVSRDQGANWTPVKPQARHDIGDHAWLVSYFGDHDPDAANRRDMGHWMDAVKINPANPDELLYGTGYGVWITKNLGNVGRGGSVEFAFANENFEEMVILGLESPPAGPRVLAAAGDVAGTAFDDFSRSPQHGLFTPTHETNQGVAFAARKPNIVVRSADNDGTRGYISLDGAETWQPLPAAPAVLTGDWHKVRAGKIAISAQGTHMVWVPEGQGAYASSDGGKTWVLSTGWPKPQRGQEAIADRVDDRIFYLFDAAKGAVLVSQDGGMGFRPLGTLSAGRGQLRAVPGFGGDVWLASDAGLYHGSREIPGIDTAWQVTFGKAAPGQIYPAVFLWGKVKGVEGLWRSDDAGGHWTRINDDAHQFGQMRAIAGDPREYGTLYIAPDGRGVMVGKDH